MHETPRISQLLEGLNNPSLPGIDLSLVRVRELMEALDNPEKRLPPVVHIAGTNGKGSTLAFLRAIFSAAGYRVHTYISPHLVRFNERIVIAGQEISDEYLLQLLERVNDEAKNIPVTFFEATTAAAFLAFAEHSADVVLLETGMGGRLDATNLVEKPIATILTPIDFDHMEFLGETLGDIAGEKAGIMKPGAPCFVGRQKPEAREVIKRGARKVKCALHLHGFDWDYEPHKTGIRVHSGANGWELPLPLLIGDHQYHNAALASVVAMALPQFSISEAVLNKGITSATWPARMQRLSYGPLVEAWGARGDVILDGGHNKSAAHALAGWMAQQQVPIILMVGMMKRKDAKAFLAPLAPHIHQFIAVPIAGHESYTAADLSYEANEAGIHNVISADSLTDTATSLDDVLQGTLLVTGSLFLAGEVLKNHG